MDSVGKDIRYAIRVLRHQPWFSLIAVSVLALGIGANTAIFSLVHAVLVKPLPYGDPDRLVAITGLDTEVQNSPLSIPDFIDYRSESRDMEVMAGIQGFGANLTGGGNPERVQGYRVTGDFFEMLGVVALHGRIIRPYDEQPGNETVALISYGLWQRRYGGDSGIVGTPVLVNDTSYIVIGVLGPDFIFPARKTDICVPLVLDAHSSRKDRGSRILQGFGRLKPDVSPERAEADLTRTALQMSRTYPETNARQTGVKVTPLKQEILGRYEPALMLLLVAVGLVLLIACGNLANMLLARGSARLTEMAIRMALGATRGRLISQLLVESLVLSLSGGVLGLLLTASGIRVLASFSPTEIPRAGEAEIAPAVLAFTIAISVVSGLVFGLAPSVHISAVNFSEELNSSPRGTSEAKGRRRIRNLLVSAEVAISIILLIGATLFVRSFIKVREIEPGFDTHNVFVMRLSLPRGRYRNSEDVTTFIDKVGARLKELPGMSSVGMISVHPLSTARVSTDFTIVGRPPATALETPAAQYRLIDSGYFGTMGIPIRRGREFTDFDVSRSQPVAIINRALADRFWPNENPVGWHIKVDDALPPFREVEVVGVAGEVKEFGLEQQPPFVVYVPYKQLPQLMVPIATNNVSVIVKSAATSTALPDHVRSAVRELDPDVPTAYEGPVDHLISLSVAARRFNRSLLAVFAAVALVLALMGIYAVTTYSVAQRRHEIGIRMAIGATPWAVVKMTVKQGMAPVFVGIGVGLAASLALGKVVSSLLYGVSYADALTYFGVALIFSAAGYLACFLPARLAAKVDPATTIRTG